MEMFNNLLSQFQDLTFLNIPATTLATWFAAGIVAGILLMGRRPIGFLGDMVIGLLGGLLGGWVSNRLPAEYQLPNLIGGLEESQALFIGNFLTAVAGAIVVLILIRLVIRKRG